MRTCVSTSIISALMVSLLSGCSSDSDSESINSENYIEGNFKHVDDSVLSRTIAGELWSYCSINNQDRVFETDRVIAWGDSSLPEEDFQFAATAVDIKLTEALENFKISYQEYLAMKPVVGRGFFKRYFNSNTYRNLLADQHYGLIEGDWFQQINRLFIKNGFSYTHDALNNIENQPEDKLSQFMADYLTTVINLNKEDGEAIQKLATENIDHLAINNARSKVPRKVVVCLDPNKDGVRWGSGNEIGIDIAPKSLATRPDELQVIHHELIHHLETTWSNPIEGVPIIDRWMAEGSAVYFSGQSLHNGAPTMNPTKVRSFIDESQHYSDLGQAYTEYGQAFKYVVDTHSIDAYFNLLDAMRHNQQDHSRLWGESKVFIEEFTSQITDYHSFTNDYPNLVK